MTSEEILRRIEELACRVDGLHDFVDAAVFRLDRDDQANFDNHRRRLKAVEVRVDRLWKEAGL